MVKKVTKKVEKEYHFTRKPIFNIHHQGDPLFAARCHPSEPVFVTGTATGHVQAYRYDYAKLMEIYEDQDKFPYDISCVKFDDFDDGSIVSQWHTKRHKKSCRDLCFDLQSGGDKVHTIGSEGVIKTADVRTGQVVNKFSCNTDSTFDGQNIVFGTLNKCLSVPNKSFLLVGDESGNLMCHDTRDKHLKLCYKPFAKLHMGEGINSINYCWPKSDYKIITTGSSTICELDLRKPEEPLFTSEDQEDELLCAAWLDQEKQETMICGMADVVTIWKPQINKWEDQISRIRVAKGETVESLISAMDAESRFMYGGCSNGHIVKIDIVGGKVVERFLQQDPEDEKIDEVLGLDLDCEYRLMSFGTDGFKIWEEESGEREEEDNDDDSDERSGSDDDDGLNTDDYGDSSDDEREETKLEKEFKESDEESDVEEKEIVEEEDDDGQIIETPTSKKRSFAASLKRRMEISAETIAKKSKSSLVETTEEVDVASEEEIGNEVPDSDDETVFSDDASKTVELHKIRDQILEKISNPDADGKKDKKKKGKKEKPGKKNHQEHGIRRFDDL